MNKTLEFKVSTALKDIVGRDLITNSNIAIFELVKNSYDAGASRVVINFKEDAIVIADNGRGMSFDDIKNKWLFLAYSEKKNRTIDKKSQRMSAGSKGIGRFSADRLGRYLTLITKTYNSNKVESIKMDWALFEGNQGKEFTQVPVDYEQLVFQDDFPNHSYCGTIITITNLHQRWPRSEILDLRRYLEKLINPFEIDKDLIVEIVCDKEKLEDKKFKNDYHKQVNGPIKNTIIDTLQLKTTQLIQKVENNHIYTKIKDRGSLIYEIEENNTYQYLTDFTVRLLFINRSARSTFTRRMGYQSVEFGSVFLFKNGIRVLPYGENGDDSWSIDRRKQQGYNRYLGTRDLIGYIAINTENQDQFKETSSRDGGLINTMGSQEIKQLFDCCFHRLERYVVGVLWGEGFKRLSYFFDEELVDKLRADLKQDKFSESANIAFSNLGSRVDFTQLIKSLAQDENIKILSYNTELTKIVAEEISSIQINVLGDIDEIAKKTNNKELQKEVYKLNEILIKSKKEKEEADQLRLIAEKQAKEAIRLQKEAEERAKLEREHRIKAEERARLDRIAKKEAELKKKEAELRRQEAEHQSYLAKIKEKKAKDKLELEIEKNTYLHANRRLTPEVEDIIHTIKILTNEVEASLINITDLSDNNINPHILKELANISFHTNRVKKLSNLLTRADISFLKEHSKIEIPQFIKEYLLNYSISIKKIEFKNNLTDKYYRKISPLDLAIILDNLVSNSKKAGATKLFVEFNIKNKKLSINFSDNGCGVPDVLIKNNKMFLYGASSTKGGSGIGLSSIRDRLQKNLFGDIVFVGNDIYLKGATFNITL